jgi:hypothetical protein
MTEPLPPAAATPSNADVGAPGGSSLVGAPAELRMTIQVTRASGVVETFELRGEFHGNDA